jgi:hypothetical protein
MADLTPVIETAEHRWMRAWMGRDPRALKALTSSKFMMLVGSKPPVILDAPSWFDAAGTRFLCKSYRFGDVYVRDLGGVTLFAAQVEMEASMDGHDWSGRMFISDVWRKGRVRRSWRMVQRVISRAEESPKVPAAIRSMQLWR